MCDIDGREPYDLIIGTSERGKHIETLVDKNGLHRGGEGGFPRFKRCMIVFGGPRGLEPVMEPLKLGPEDCFDYYVNTCASQGSRTIRTEEAALISAEAAADGAAGAAAADGAAAAAAEDLAHAMEATTLAASSADEPATE